MEKFFLSEDEFYQTFNDTEDYDYSYYESYYLSREVEWEQYLEWLYDIPDEFLLSEISRNDSAIGERLKIARKLEGFTQEQLAEKLGIAKKTIISYESGNTTTPLSIIKDLSVLYKISIYELISSEKNNNQNSRVKDILKYFQRTSNLGYPRESLIDDIQEELPQLSDDDIVYTHKLIMLLKANRLANE